MKSIYVLALLAIAASACGPNQFEFQQVAGGTPTDICPDGCSNGENNILFDYNETVTNDRKVDILFIDDNSGSMAEEQANMATRFPTFISSLVNVDWQVGITTTDVTNGGAEGNLVTFEGTNLKVINSSTPDAEMLFRDTIQMGTNGSGDERGIFASVLAVQKNEDLWMRANSHLAIVIISDEDERSDGTNLQTNDLPETLVSTVKNRLGQSKSFTAHTIVTRPDDTVCLNGDGQSYGTVYAALSTMTGGILGDICAADYGAQLQTIAQNIQNTFDSVTLKCKPINGVVDVTFTPAPTNAVTTRIENDKMFFSETLATGTSIHLVYECKK